MRGTDPVPGHCIADANAYVVWSERVVDDVDTGVNAEGRLRPTQDGNTQATDSAVEESFSKAENLYIFDHFLMFSRIRISLEGRTSGKVNDRFSPEMGLPNADMEMAGAP